MVDLAPGSHVSVENPNLNIETSMPGKVNNVWLKEGPAGAVGPTGATGPANTLTIGTVTTGAAGSLAAAAVTGTAPNQTLGLTIPRGDTGATGSTGPTGPANSLSIGTVTTGAAGSSASASIAGTAPTQTLSLTIPKGDQGIQGIQGPTGPAGAGDVVGPASSVDLRIAVFSGTTGKLLAQGNNTIGGVLSRANHTGTQAASTITGLAAVATTGAYTDLSGKPTLGTAAAANTGTGAGNVPVLSGSPGTPDGTKFFRDDGTWAIATGGGGGGLLAAASYTLASGGVTTNTTTLTGIADSAAAPVSITFTPTGTRVLIRVTALAALNGTSGDYYWGLRDGATTVQEKIIQGATANNPGYITQAAAFLVTGLTAGVAKTFQFAHRTSATTLSGQAAGSTASAGRGVILEAMAA